MLLIILIGAWLAEGHDWLAPIDDPMNRLKTPKGGHPWKGRRQGLAWSPLTKPGSQ